MDNLIPVIIFLIVIWSIFSKIKQQKKQSGAGGKPARTGGLVDRINAFLSDVQRQMEEEAAKRQGSGPADLTDWSRLVDEQEAEMPARPMAEDSLDDLVLEVEAPVPEYKPKPPVRPPRPAARGLRKVETPPPAPPQPAMAAVGEPTAKRAGSRADLRRAIVWSEILGPPVSLRDRGSDRF